MKFKFKIIFSLIVVVVVIGLAYFSVQFFDMKNRLDVFEKVDQIDASTNIEQYGYTNTLKDEVGVEILGEKEKEFMQYFETNTLPVDVFTYNDLYVKVAPVSDFVNNQIFYYKDSKLVLYESESNTIGGSVRYYFDNDKLISVKADPELTGDEEASEILTRAKSVYEKYLK